MAERISTEESRTVLGNPAFPAADLSILEKKVLELSAQEMEKMGRAGNYKFDEKYIGKPIKALQEKEQAKRIESLAKHTCGVKNLYKPANF